MKTKLHFFFYFLAFSSSLIVSQTQKAKYSITFTSVWNSTDHGVVPTNAHWSKLVGATHKTSGAFLEMGKLATTGIKNIAEVGNNTVFNTEVTTAINANEANQYINGPNLGTATGNMIITGLIVDKDFPLISLASMIAPSPDWMIAVNGFNLLDLNNNWKSTITLDLFAYDAGTDSGTNYTSSNLVTNPFQNISSLKNVSPFNDKKIGTLTISLTETLSLEQFIKTEAIAVFYHKSSKSIKIEDSKNNIKQLKVYSVYGNLVNQEFKKNSKNLDISKLSNGIYILKIATRLGTYSKKIIKH